MEPRKPVTTKVRSQCAIRDKAICQICHKTLMIEKNADLSVRAEFHHITPVCVGGIDTYSNIVTLCHECHMKEHKKVPFKNKQMLAEAKRDGGEIFKLKVIHELQSNLNPQDRYWRGLMKAIDLIESIKGDTDDGYNLPLPDISLVYVPAPRPTSKREKKGVSG